MTATIAHDEHARMAARVQQGVSGVVEHDIRFDHEVGIVLGEPGNGLRDDDPLVIGRPEGKRLVDRAPRLAARSRSGLYSRTALAKDAAGPPTAPAPTDWH